MNFDQFIGAVQNRARCSDSGDSLGATRATLSTLGERLDRGENLDIESQLPNEIAKFIVQPASNESFDVDEFYNRVARREEVEKPRARFHARAVISVLEEAISPGELRDALDQLPEEYDDLFNFSPEEIPNE